MSEFCVLLPTLPDVNSSTLTKFFVHTLKIRDVSCDDMTDELVFIKKSSTTNIENIHDIYGRLQNMASSLSSEDLDDLR